MRIDSWLHLTLFLGLQLLASLCWSWTALAKCPAMHLTSFRALITLPHLRFLSQDSDGNLWLSRLVALAG
jgi:hypothetical protein